MAEVAHWRLRYEAKPWTINMDHNMHWGAHAQRVSEWRNSFHWLAKEQKVPRCERIAVIVAHSCKTKRLPDPGACMPAVKAAIDGLVDAGVIDNDTGEFVSSIKFMAPIHTGHDAVELLIIAIKEAPCPTPPRTSGSSSSSTTPSYAASEPPSVAAISPGTSSWKD